MVNAYTRDIMSCVLNCEENEELLKVAENREQEVT
jgi:hypothetical protein